MLRVDWRDICFLVSQCVLEGQGSSVDYSRNTGVGQCHFPHLSFRDMWGCPWDIAGVQKKQKQTLTPGTQAWVTLHEEDTFP